MYGACASIFGLTPVLLYLEKDVGERQDGGSLPCSISSVWLSKVTFQVPAHNDLLPVCKASWKAV